MKTKSGASGVIIRALARLQKLCGKSARRLHTDGAGEQDTPDVKEFLDKHGITHTKTAPGSSQANAIVERRFESIFAAARSALKAAPPPLNGKGYWSLAALDAIDKANYLPFKRQGNIVPSPHTAMQLHDCDTDELKGPQAFLPFGQPGFIVDTMKFKKKLQDRAVPANYVRCLSKDTYQVYRRDKRNITTIRQSEFVLTLEQISKNDKPANIPQQAHDERPADANTQNDKRINQAASKDTITQLDRLKEKWKKHGQIVRVKSRHETTGEAATHSPTNIIKKYALGQNSAYPDQTGGDIEGEMDAESTANKVRAFVAKISPKVTCPPPPPPKTLNDAKARPDYLSYAKAHDEELDRHGPNGLHTYDFVEALPSDRPIPFVMTYKAKTNQYGGLERHKARLAIRGDRMRPGIDFDETRTASHMPSQAGRRLLILAGVAEGHSFRSLDVPGAR